MSSSEQVKKDLHKGDENTKRINGSFCDNKLKIALASVLVLAVIALIAAVCTTIAVLSVSISHSSHSSATTESVTSLENKADMLNEVRMIVI